LNQLDKSLTRLSARLGRIEESTRETKAETDEERASRFAKLRLERNDKWKRLGRRPTYEEVVNEITEEEWNYYKRKNLEVPPEQRYQNQKEEWFFHESSWYYRGEERYDGHGCNGVCVPECRYYPEKGRIEDEEVFNWYKNKD